MSYYRQGLAVGAESAGEDGDKRKGDSVMTWIVLGVLTVLVFALSPGALHFYKHGRLPPG